jgi:hypothetical protein
MTDLRTGDLDGEGWGRWDGVPLPQWLRLHLAPYNTAARERRLQELMDAFVAKPVSTPAPAAGAETSPSRGPSDPSRGDPPD